MSSSDKDSKKSKNRSRKRKYTGGKNPSNKRIKLDYEVDLTKGRNVILCSAERMKEVLCGKDLQLVFTEYIEEMLKIRKEKQNETKDTKPNGVDSNCKPKENETKTKDEPNNNENGDEDEDDDLKVNNNKNNENDKNVKNENNKNKQNVKEEENNDKNEKNVKMDEDEDEDDDLNINIADQIKSELTNFSANKLCEWIKAPPGLVVIDILEPSISATELLEYVFKKFHPKRPNLSPFVYNLYPINKTSFSRQDEMINLGKNVIESFDWDKIPKEDEYAIDYKNRGNKSLDRNKIIRGIASFMPDKYKVNLTNPKTVILLQTFGRTSGISIITNGIYAKYKKYNMSGFAE